MLRYGHTTWGIEHQDVREGDNVERSEWFARQLAAGLELFVWAVGQMPAHLLRVPPPRHPDDWPVARHVFHLTHYERTLALPSMRQWDGGPPPESFGIEQDAAREEAAWYAARETPLGEMIDQLQHVRNEQIQLARAFAGAAWDDPRDALWGRVPLAWVVTKTLQHTAEHTHDVLRLVLWQGKPPE